MVDIDAKDVFSLGALVKDTSAGGDDVAVCFPGHGSQSLDMFDGFIARSPAAKRLIGRADEVYAARYGQPLTKVIGDGTKATLMMPQVMQPAIVTASVAMFEAIREHSIPVGLLMGHSLGEYSALIASGAVSFEDGLSAVLDRAECIASIPEGMRGAMAATKIDSPETEALVRAVVAELAYRGPIVVGIVNSNSQMVVSGSTTLVDQAISDLKACGVQATKLAIPVGFHSEVLSPVLPDLHARLKRYEWKTPTIPVVSTITRSVLGEHEVKALPELLAGQLVTSFDFRDCVAACERRGIRIFIDAGPKGIVGRLIGESLQSGRGGVVRLDYGAAKAEKTEDRLDGLRWLCGGNIAGSVTDNHAGDVAGADAGAAEEGAGANRVADAAIDTGEGAVADDTGRQETVANDAEYKETARDNASKNPAITDASLGSLLVDVFCEVTGYPSDVLDPDMDLEGDLGIDSVKQMEALGKVADRLGLDPQDVDLSEVHTLRQLEAELRKITISPSNDDADSSHADMTNQEANTASEGGNQEKTGSAPISDAARLSDSIPSDSSFASAESEKPAKENLSDENLADGKPGSGKITDGDLGALLVDVFCEVTGYPSDVLDPDMDLEGDLGIDSVKQMEALGKVADRLGLDPQDVDLSEVHTLRQLEAELRSMTNQSVADGQGKDAANQGVDEASVTGATNTTNATNAANAEDGNESTDAIDRTNATNPANDNARSANEDFGRFVPQLVVSHVDDNEETDDFSDAGCLVVSSGDARLDLKVSNALRPFVAQVKTIVLNAEGPQEAVNIPHFDRPLRVVVDCHALLDRFNGADIAQNEWMRHVERAYASVFSLSKALLADVEGTKQPFAWVSLTNSGGISGIGSEGTKGTGNPLGALNTGFYKSLCREYENLTIKTIDLDECDRAPEIVADELRHFSARNDTEIGYVDGQRQVVRVIPLEIKQEHSVRQKLKAGTVALFSGGSRGIALECAKALADEQPDIEVVVTGRSDIHDPSAQPWLRMEDEAFKAAKPDFMRRLHVRSPQLSAASIADEYERIGHIRMLARNMNDFISSKKNLHYYPCDVSNAQSVQSLVDRVQSELGPISLVVHAAGLESFGRLSSKSLEKTLECLKVKVAGFRNLYMATLNDESLSAFVSFGSVSGRFGMDGQVDYTAGAALLAALSYYLSMDASGRRPDVSFTTLEWSAWAGVGMAADPKVMAVQSKGRGMDYLPVETGRRFFLDELAVGLADPEVLVLGGLGSNKPLGQLDALDEHRRLISVVDADGYVIDKPHFPLIDRFERKDQDNATAYRDLRYDRDLYLPDHRVKSMTTFPGLLHMETQVEAAAYLVDPHRYGVELDSVSFDRFLKCRDNDEVPVSVSIHRQGPQIETKLYSTFKAPNGRVLIPKRFHSGAKMHIVGDPFAPYRADWSYEELMKEGVAFDLDRYYASTAHFISFGPTFRYVRQARLVNDNCMVGQFVVSAIPGLFSDVRNPRFLCCPLLIDNVGRMALMREFQLFGRHIVPTMIRGGRQYRCPAAREVCYGKVTVLGEDENTVDTNMEIVDQEGFVLCKADRVTLTKLGPSEDEHDILQRS
ncbi:SDR family NAD(P)-dependent oxidoreductase [Bifidobacterium sp. ESL0690]|uniref:SDR family NAD(P)-dependent oxidoreductase n=1 Tax=Bifidobacterium sp. ESL0690 TaxID=2983214 RepID=UPI0023F7DE75|nr:SDR family NAD(P)-dependent oxidoreductase [Bifidobacterium sp. ESL0690]WEV47402.1 SDR family NAD(P)-dependent oxidoreductase [Bifidobacterium sp. ESL0690]